MGAMSYHELHFSVITRFGRTTLEQTPISDANPHNQKTFTSESPQNNHNHNFLYQWEILRGSRQQARHSGPPSGQPLRGMFAGEAYFAGTVEDNIQLGHD